MINKTIAETDFVSLVKDSDITRTEMTAYTTADNVEIMVINSSKYGDSSEAVVRLSVEAADALEALLRTAREARA